MGMLMEIHKYQVIKKTAGITFKYAYTDPQAYLFTNITYIKYIIHMYAYKYVYTFTYIYI